MEKEHLFFGKILGELYRIEKKLGMNCSATDGKIVGLLNGIEPVINDEIERVGSISGENLKSVEKVLNEYSTNQGKLCNFKGFYDIEKRLVSEGVDRATAINILKYLNATGQFKEVIGKMDSSGSPTECRNFDLDKCEY